MPIVASKRTYFEIIQMAGEGLNSCVYKALRKDASELFCQTVALKILKSRDNVSSWRQELESLFQVTSPFCVKVFDFEWINDQPALVLEWLDGLTLSQLFESSELTSDLSIEVLLQIQEGLIDLHMAGLCHGDLHMENVFVTTSGQIKLLDFGFANISRIQSQGSPSLRAPELDSGSEPSFWTDLYALGRIAESLNIPAEGLLEINPESRDLLRGARNPNSASQLAEHVAKALNRRRLIADQKTIRVKNESPMRTPWHHYSYIILLSLFFLIQPASSMLIHPPPFCKVEFRAKKWLSIQSESLSEHFAPYDHLSESCRPLKFYWKSADSGGEMEISFGSQKVIKLSDEDFR